MITASPPRCSTCTCLASSLTAIRPVIFSMNGCRMPWNALSALDFGFAVWKVATIGPSATISASMDRLGATGSCTCSTSKFSARSQRRTRL